MEVMFWIAWAFMALGILAIIGIAFWLRRDIRHCPTEIPVAGGGGAGGEGTPSSNGFDGKPEGISWQMFTGGTAACFLLASLVIYAGFGRFSTTIFETEGVADTGITVSAAWILFWLLAAYIAAGLKRVGPTEVAVKEILWGLFFQIVPTGPTIVPPFISRLHRFLQTIFTFKIGGSEKSDVKGVTIDMKRGVIECDTPLQAYFPNAVRQPGVEKQAELKDRTPAWLLVTITARIDAKRAISLLKTGGTLRRVALRIEETTRGVIAQECNRRALSETLDTLEDVAQAILFEIEDLVGDVKPTPMKEPDPVTGLPKARTRNNPSKICWGIDVLRVQLETPKLTAELQGQIDATQKATQTAEQTRRTAEGEEAELAAKGRGNASARKDWMLAEAEGMQAQARVAETPHGRFVRMLERDETVAEHAKPMIVTSGDAYEAAVARTKVLWDAVQEKGNQPKTTTEKKGGA